MENIENQLAEFKRLLDEFEKVKNYVEEEQA